MTNFKRKCNKKTQTILFYAKLDDKHIFEYNEIDIKRRKKKIKIINYHIQHETLDILNFYFTVFIVEGDKGFPSKILTLFNHFEFQFFQSELFIFIHFV